MTKNVNIRTLDNMLRFLFRQNTQGSKRFRDSKCRIYRFIYLHLRTQLIQVLESGSIKYHVNLKKSSDFKKCLGFVMSCKDHSTFKQSGIAAKKVS